VADGEELKEQLCVLRRGLSLREVFGPTFERVFFFVPTAWMGNTMWEDCMGVVEVRLLPYGLTVH